MADAPKDQAIAQLASAEAHRIEIEVTVVDLSAEQKAKFGNYAEFWNVKSDSFYEDAKPEGFDAAEITEAVRVTFHGWYDPEEDDFEGKTYFTRTLAEDANPVVFSKKDKQLCGFLYLRSLRTGARALSLELLYIRQQAYACRTPPLVMVD